MKSKKSTSLRYRPFSIFFARPDLQVHKCIIFVEMYELSESVFYIKVQDRGQKNAEVLGK